MLSVNDALTRILASVVSGPAWSVELERAPGEILREPISCARDVPPFDKALMDGFAIRARDVANGPTELTLLEMLPAGRTSEHILAAGEAIQIMTGAPLPAGADAIVVVEESEVSSDRRQVFLRPRSSVEPGRNIMPRGSVMQAGEVVLSQGHRLRHQEVALLAELGHVNVPVSVPPRVGILATGDELVPLGQTPGAAQICNSNESMLVAQVRDAHGDAIPLGIARDDLEDLRQKIEIGLQHDFLLLSGGVSAGERDLVPQVLSHCGVSQVFHKVHIKPGKPIWFGTATKSDQSRTYVFGLPGNPVSSMVCFEVFVRPALRAFRGDSPLPERLRLPLAKAHVARGDRPTYHPARLVRRSDGLAVGTISWKGSSDLLATTRSDCLILVPGEDRELPAGELVDVLCPRIE